ncbi:MAG: phage portal protein [Candidatus Saccharibacteria bacterium]|nr:phage portal protein [Candidatus Saccharibacteria bacterium]
MYQVDKNTKLSAELVRKAVQYNEKRREHYDQLYEYYIGKQAIMDRQKVSDIVSNNKLMINHARYIVKVCTGYLLGTPVSYQANDDEDITAVTDAYKKQSIDNLDSKIAKDCSIYGHKYEYIYADENAEVKSVELDVRNTIIVYDNTMMHSKLYGINYRPIYDDPTDNVPDHYEVVVATKGEIIEGTLSGSMTNFTEVSRTPHYFGAVPFIEYVNNDEMQGDFEPVVSLIDAYNLIQSDRVNDREQLVDAILLFYGMDFSEKQMDLLKNERALAGIPEDGKVEYLTKNVSESDNDVLRQNIEKDIHKISMVPNMADENFAGNSSGVALRYKLLNFEQLTKDKERYFEKGLMERFALYMHFLTVKSTMAQVPIEDVDAIFVRNLPSNDYETSQMINNLLGLVDKKLLASQLSFVRDADETVELAEAEAESKPAESEYAEGDFGDQNATPSTTEPTAAERPNEAA